MVTFAFALGLIFFGMMAFGSLVSGDSGSVSRKTDKQLTVIVVIVFQVFLLAVLTVNNIVRIAVTL